MVDMPLRKGPSGPLASVADEQLYFDVDIRTFGAVSGSDASTAINDAVQSLPNGGRVIIPAGTWDISEEITLDIPGITLVGSKGSKLRKQGTDHHLVRITADKCSVQHLDLDGNFKPQGALITINSSDCFIFDNYLHDNGVMADGPYANQSHGITLDGQLSACARNNILGNKVTNCHDIGISQHTTTDNRIIDNEVTLNGLEGITIDVTSHRARVALNRISGNAIRGGVGGIGIDGSDLWVIKGNIISSTDSGLSGIKTQNNTGPSNYGIIDGNILLDNEGFGIWLFNGSSGAASNNVVSNNVSRGNASFGIKVDAGCDNNVIEDNSGTVSDLGANNSDMTIRRAFAGQFNTSNSDGNVGNGVLNCSGRRVGDCFEGQVRLAVGSSVITGTGNIEFRLPRSTDAGYGGVDLTIDEAKLNNGAGSLVVSAGIITDASANDRRPVMINEGHNKNFVGLALTGNITAGGTVTMANPWAWANGDVINIWFTVPIEGWSIS